MNLINLIDDAETAQQIEEFLHQIRDEFEVDHVAYAGTNPISGKTYGHVTFPAEWTEHYLENRYHEIDPTLLGARASIAPVDWRRLERSEEFQTVFRNAKDYGIGERGLTIPVRGPYGDIGGFSVMRDCSEREWDTLLEKNISQLQSVAVHLHDAVMREDPLSRILKSPALSSREVEILQWTAAGKSQQDIGDILTISHRTVEVHLRSAREKLYALTTSQAVGRAISQGLIYPR